MLPYYELNAGLGDQHLASLPHVGKRQAEVYFQPTTQCVAVHAEERRGLAQGVVWLDHAATGAFLRSMNSRSAIRASWEMVRSSLLAMSSSFRRRSDSTRTAMTSKPS